MGFVLPPGGGYACLPLVFSLSGWDVQNDVGETAHVLKVEALERTGVGKHVKQPAAISFLHVLHLGQILTARVPLAKPVAKLSEATVTAFETASLCDGPSDAAIRTSTLAT